MTDFLPKRWIWFNHSIYTWLVKFNDLDKKVKSIREGKHSMVNKEMFELGSLIRKKPQCWREDVIILSEFNDKYHFATFLNMNIKCHL